ncbi:urea carboxylase [Luteolibacter yonseiensis]|uniref:Urea carboxylase n=1 Tax=Luteolibacter yonseiensis TaxID=1144680 RepID=A0A934QZ26_9BACT|nr:urea carboxylase [Luteolibacter yonseiensis]MBK1815343.1 urea carboxylase [Luteolibacter yonseiensis]
MKILIANRGEIAARAIRTFQKLGYRSIAVYSDPDAGAPHVDLADEARHLGPGPVSESYLLKDKLLEIALESGADAVFPGYGLLSENTDFARMCEDAGVRWLGPTPEQIIAFGLKHEARRLAGDAGVPLVPGTGLLENAEAAISAAEGIGYPVMLKSTAGGGGIGMKVCRDADELRREFESVVRLSERSFGSGGVFIERFIQRGRHVEVQIFGDGNGKVLALGERDCSVQRRNQKVFEETPAPDLPDRTRTALHAAAVKLGESVNYRSAGTVEFIYDADRDDFFFLEVNTRLQVEHGVTELVTGIDLVEWMVRLALDRTWKMPDASPTPRGCAIQARVYAEDPNHNFRPSCGLLTEAVFPDWTRCDGWISPGTEVSPFYDPLLAKVMVHGEDRETAVHLLEKALDETKISGIETNLRYLRGIVRWTPYLLGGVAMRDMVDFSYTPRTIDVLSAGTMTTVQDWPGRVGYWEVGVPPCGPFDPLSLRLANTLVGNEEGTAGLEITMTGPTLRFNSPAVIAVAGASALMLKNGEPVPMNEAIAVEAGDVLKIGRFEGAGARAYLSVAGGIESPEYLGSCSTFTLGKFGGPFGRALLPGDVLGIRSSPAGAGKSETPHETGRLKPAPLGHDWRIAVLYGPHGSPDFFLDEDIDTFFATQWEVHYNSARTGVRLIGPKPKWARADGGEAGLHPSNLHDNAYAIGAVDFTGDMPVILGPDGPSLGGFVCPVVVVDAELWKLGQLRPGDRIRFVPVDEAWARDRQTEVAEFISGKRSELADPSEAARGSCFIDSFGEGDDAVVVRRAGDRYFLIEFGPHHLDLKLRFKVHVVHEWLKERAIPGILDLTPGIRSLQVHFDPGVIGRGELWKIIRDGIEGLPPLEQIEVPTRVVHLPLSWEDPSTLEAIRRYMQSVRPDAPWCPSNLEFIRRINDLESIDEVRRIFFEASYLVMGLGDVYLGAPVATPLDPRHRMVTTKYNPARTWTPENAVGIGGAYLCIYGMEGPGGYQFTGRTIPVWNRWRKTADFEKPWLLRFFDQLRFHPVSAEELLRLREEVPRGRHKLEIEEKVFRFSDYEAFLAENSAGIEAFQNKQRAGYEAERKRWEEAGLSMDAPAETVEEEDTVVIPEGCSTLDSPVTGSVWKVEALAGTRIAAGTTALILEAMKMEVPLEADEPLEIVEILVAEGASVRAGQPLVIVKPAI